VGHGLRRLVAGQDGNAQIQAEFTYSFTLLGIAIRLSLIEDAFRRFLSVDDVSIAQEDPQSALIHQESRHDHHDSPAKYELCRRF
jgi:hypothetical protein